MAGAVTTALHSAAAVRRYRLTCRVCGVLIGEVEAVYLPKGIAHLCVEHERRRVAQVRALANNLKLSPGALRELLA